MLCYRQLAHFLAGTILLFSPLVLVTTSWPTPAGRGDIFGSALQQVASQVLREVVARGTPGEGAAPRWLGAKGVGGALRIALHPRPHPLRNDVGTPPPSKSKRDLDHRSTARAAKPPTSPAPPSSSSPCHRLSRRHGLDREPSSALVVDFFGKKFAKHAGGAGKISHVCV